MDVGAIFKALVWDNVVTYAIAQLFIALPFLGWGPIGVVVSFIIHWVGDRIFEAVKMAVDLELIVLRNEAHKQAYNTESLRLKIIAHDKGIDSPEFKEARDAGRKALSTFIGFAT